MTTAKYSLTDTKQKVKRIIEGTKSPYILGRELHNLDVALSRRRPKRSISTILKQTRIRGKSRGRVYQFVRLYRMYPNPSEGELHLLRTIDEKRAWSLAQIYEGKLTVSGQPDPNSFIYPPNEALKIAASKQQKVSQKALRVIFKHRLNFIPPFENEQQIQKWFLSSEIQSKNSSGFLPGQGITTRYPQAAAGPANGFIDYVFERADGLKTTVALIELKDVADNQAIGQVLGQRNELSSRVENHLAHVYPKSRADLSSKGTSKPKVYSRENAREIPCDSVESWLVAQVFADSAYFAAKGQDIFLIRIDENQRMRCLHGKDKNFTQETWLDFAGKVHLAEPRRDAPAIIADSNAK